MRGTIALIALLCAASCRADMPPALAALAAAEREFAAAGARDGVQKSFLAHFADDAVVLRPFATPARDWYRAHADTPGKLLWAPQYLALSAAGDLGVSSGPWRFEGKRDGKPASAHGHFFSIWRHDRENGWRVVLDQGVGHAAPAAAVEDTALVALAPAAAAARRADLPARERALAVADDALRARLASGAPGAYAALARPGTLWLRAGAVPVRAAQAPAADAHACGCGPRVRLAVAASGDLGYVVGGAESARDKGIDVRVWRFDSSGGWSLLADLAAAAP